MELKVQVEKLTRIVCGLNDETTVQDVILALAHSLKQTGRFYLIEKLDILDTQNKKTKQESKKIKISQNRRPSSQIFINNNSNARVMSPEEKPLAQLRNYSHLLNGQDNNVSIEFHLIRSTSDRPEQVASELIEQINELNSCSIREYKNQLYFNEETRSANHELEIETCRSSSSSSRSNNSSRSSIRSSSSFFSTPLSLCDAKTSTSSLLEDIGRQQKVLQDQSSKLDRLLKKIEKYEIAQLELSQKSETFRLKLSQLEHANKVNMAKLMELECDTNENLLHKEIELAEFLQAQREYYERKVNDCKCKLEVNANILEELETSLRSIKEELDSNESHGLHGKHEPFIDEYNDSLKEAELNKARLEYLNVSLMNLDKHLADKLEQINCLEKEFNILKGEHLDDYYRNAESEDKNVKQNDNSSFSSTISDISCSSTSSDFLAPILSEKYFQNSNDDNNLVTKELGDSRKFSSSIEFDHIYYF